jgi:hypothetical protein
MHKTPSESPLAPTVIKTIGLVAFSLAALLLVLMFALSCRQPAGPAERLVRVTITISDSPPNLPEPTAYRHLSAPTDNDNRPQIGSLTASNTPTDIDNPPQIDNSTETKNLTESNSPSNPAYTATYQAPDQSRPATMRTTDPAYPATSQASDLNYQATFPASEHNPLATFWNRLTTVPVSDQAGLATYAASEHNSLATFPASEHNPLATFWNHLATLPASNRDHLATFPASEHSRLATQTNLPESRGIVVDPAPPLAELQVLLDGSGPGTAAFSDLVVNGGSTSLSLVTGDWLFQARALDSQGKTFLAGSSSTRVQPSGGTNVIIKLSPIPGTGSLSISYVPPAQAASTATWHCTLNNSTGATTASWTDPLASSGRTLPDIPTGYYALATRLENDGLTLAGSVDLIRILGDRTTSVIAEALIPASGARLGINLDLRSPLAFDTTILSRSAVRGFNLRVRAEGPATATYQWSAMGNPLGQGTLLDLPTDNLPQQGTIDVIAFGDNSAGAASLPFNLTEPQFRNGWAMYGTVSLSEEPLSQVLSRPAMLATSAAGDCMVIASDATASKVEVWLPDPLSSELTPRGSAGIKIGASTKKASLLTIAANGSWLAAAASESAWIWLAPVLADGSIGTPVEISGGSGDLATMGYIRGLAISPDASTLYALSNSDRSVYSFSRTGSAWTWSGRLCLDDLPCGTLSVLRTMTISGDGTRLAIAAASSDTVILLGSDGLGLTWLGEAKRTAGFTDIDYPQALAFNQDGSILAVASKDTACLTILDTTTLPPSTITTWRTDQNLPFNISALSFNQSATKLGICGEASAAILDITAIPGNLARFNVDDSPALASPTGLAAIPGTFFFGSAGTGNLVMIRTPTNP